MAGSNGQSTELQTSMDPTKQIERLKLFQLPPLIQLIKNDDDDDDDDDDDGGGGGSGVVEA